MLLCKMLQGVLQEHILDKMEQIGNIGRCTAMKKHGQIICLEGAC